MTLLLFIYYIRHLLINFHDGTIGICSDTLFFVMILATSSASSDSADGDFFDIGGLCGCGDICDCWSDGGCCGCREGSCNSCDDDRTIVGTSF